MDIAVSTYSLSRWRREQGKRVEHCLDWLAEIGVGAVEFVGLGETEVKEPRKRARRLRQRCQQLGLRVVGYCCGGELYHHDDQQQRQQIETIKQQIDLAAELEVPSMRHDVTRGPRDGDEAGLDEVLQRITPAVRELTEHGADRGVVTSIENHGFYMQTAERIERLIQAVDHPNFRLTMDLGNFLCLNQDPVDAARRLARYAVMVHAKDFRIKPIDRVPPDAPEIGRHPAVGAGWLRTPTEIALRGTIAGHGDLDLPTQLQALKAVNYGGPLSLEFEGPEDPLSAIRLGVAYLNEQLAAL